MPWRGPLLALSVWLALGLLHCLPQEQLPEPTGSPPPPSCGNDLCEPSQGENDVNCVKDCPHCWVVFAVRSDESTVVDEPTGRSDGRTVELAENQAIDLTFPRELQLDESSPSVQLYGSVTGSAPAAPTGCPAVESTTGAVLVQTSVDGRSNLQTIGLWTQGGTTEFSLGCARQVTSTRFLRLVALSGATLKVDAAQARYRSDIEQDACGE